MKVKLFLCTAAVFAAAVGTIGNAANVTVTGEERKNDGFSLTVTSDETVIADVYTAIYENDELKSVNIQKNVSVDGNAVIELPDATVGARVYLWDSSLNPLCVPYTIKGDSDGGDGIIHLCGTYAKADGIENVTTDGAVVTINAAGDYIIEGTLTDGQLVVSDSVGKSETVNIELRGVNITCSDSAPFNGGGGKINLTLADNTVNTFSDSGEYTAYTTAKAPKGCVYSKRDLTVGGASETGGKLIVNGNVKNGLVSGADIKIKNYADVEVKAQNNAIKGDNSVTFTKKTGTVSVNAVSGDGIKTDSVSDEGTIETDKGFVEIKGGNITVNAPGGDGIQADNYVDISGDTVLTITAGQEGIKANEALLPAVGDDDNQLTDSDNEPIYVNGTINISGGAIGITSAEDGIKAAEKIELSGGTVTVASTGDNADAVQVGKSEDTVTDNGDGTTTTETTVTVKGTLNISGGTLNITQAADDAVNVKGDFEMSGGKVCGNAVCDFFKVYDNVVITGGELDIVAGNDGIQSGKSMTETVNESGTVTSESNYTVGNAEISGGDIKIITNGGHTTKSDDSSPSSKGIKSNTELNISGGTFEIDSADDAIHSNYNVTVTGGTFELATADDGIHADYILTLGSENGGDDDYTVNISTSYEGLEGSVIKILSGTTYLYATDDGINAAGDYAETTVNAAAWGGNGGNMNGGSGNMGPGGGADDSAPYGMLYIKGGKTYVEAYGDGLDSNGSIEISGGVTLVNGPTSGGNGVFDKGDSSGSTFKVTGGTLIGAGVKDMVVTPDTITNGYFVSSSGSGGNRPGGSGTSASYSAGKPLKLITDNGNIVFVPKVNSSWLFVTTPDMTSGKSYSVSSVSEYSGGNRILGVTSNNVFYGLIENVQ